MIINSYLHIDFFGRNGFSLLTLTTDNEAVYNKIHNQYFAARPQLLPLTILWFLLRKSYHEQLLPVYAAARQLTITCAESILLLTEKPLQNRRSFFFSNSKKNCFYPIATAGKKTSE